MPEYNSICPECEKPLCLDTDKESVICPLCGRPIYVPRAVILFEDAFPTKNVEDYETPQTVAPPMHGERIISLGNGDQAVKTETVNTDDTVNSAQTVPTVSSLLKRLFMFLEDGEWENAAVYCEKILDIAPENPQAYLGKLMAELKIREVSGLSECAEPFENFANYKKALRFADSALKAQLSECVEGAKLKAYGKAKLAMDTASAPKEYEQAAELFKAVESYRDSAYLGLQCLKLAAASMLDGQALLAELEEVEMLEAALPAEKRGLEAQISELNLRISKLCLLQSEWDEKNTALEEMQAENDALTEEKARLTSERAYAGIFAIKRKKEITLRLEEIAGRLDWLIPRIGSVKTSLLGYGTLSELEAAIEDDRQKLSERRAKLEKLTSLRQSSQIREELKQTEHGKRLLERYDWKKSFKVGKYVEFGSYEQGEGKAPIEWLVLAADGEKALLISRFGLDCQPYNESYDKVTWAGCTLRKWLNGKFLNAAFSADEIKRIPTVTVTADANPSYDSKPGKDTNDKVFCLSITEAEKYFSNAGKRACNATEHAISKGAQLEGSACWWWLRSPGERDDYASSVFFNGRIRADGPYVSNDTNAVRPAIWLDLNA